MYASKNSKEALDYASKRKAQLEKAQTLKDAREREKKRSEMSSLSDTFSSLNIDTSSPSSLSSFQQEDSLSLSSKIADNKTIDLSKPRIASRTPKASNSSYDIVSKNKNSSSVNIETYNDAKGNTIAERIVIRPQQTITTSTTVLPKKAVPVLSSTRSSYDHNDDRSNGNDQSQKAKISSPYHRHPIHPEGRLLDLSDRPITCSASNSQGGEVVFGGSDHMIHCVNINDERKPTIRMNGHTDWLTNLSYTCDNRIISGGMDGLLFLWSTDRRRNNSLTGGHSKSISKVISNIETPIAITASYDGNIAIWNLSSNTTTTAESKLTTRTIVKKVGNSRSSATSSAILPTQILRGVGNEPIVDCVYDGNVLVSIGDRSGRIMSWDMETGTAIANIRAHSGPITSLLYPNIPNMLISSSVDGYTKVWDLRSNVDGTGLVSKTFTHYGISPSKKSTEPIGMATTCMHMIDYLSSGSLSYLISGGADSAVVIQDLRQNGEVITRWDNHCRNGIYSMSVADQSKCVFVGDGAGMAMCYDTSSGQLKYGLGASETGAVSVMHTFQNRLICGSEDGKAMIYSYA